MVKNTKMLKYKVKKIDDKLILTSTDIQVGDKVRSFNYPEQEEREVVNLRTSKKLVGAEDHSEIYHLADIQYPNEVNTSAVTGFFKVIGEISEDALPYTKEGDEFDEDSVQEIWDSSTGWRKHKIGELKDSDKPRWYGRKLPILLIKGPCGHFH